MLVTFTKGWENDHAVVFPNTVVSAEYLKIAKPIRMAKTKKKTWTQLTIPSAGDHMEQLELNYTLMGGSPSTTPQKTVWYCLLKMMACIVCMCVCMCMSVHAQLCPTLCDPMDCNLPGSSVHGIFQARILECIAISFSRGSSWLRDLVSPALTGWFFTTAPPGNLTCMLYDLAIPPLHVYSREIKEHGHKKTSTRMFPAALFVIALNWEQLK